MTSILLIGFFVAGCGEPVRTGEESKELAAETGLGPTIGSSTEVLSFDAIIVEGYALVGGLNGTGSSECPPQIRKYLKKYILKQLPGEKNVEKFIYSRNTAVVLVHGIMPMAVSKNQRFDVSVIVLPGTQTTSLQGGHLWGAELHEAGMFGMATRVLATAQGPIFIDKMTDEASEIDKKMGYVLAGGTVLDEYKIRLTLRQPEYRLANQIRNRLNERFGDGTAKAISEDQIDLRVPARYKKQKQKFISIVKATYLVQTQEIIKRRVSELIRRLAVTEEKDTSEVALEAIGNESIGKLTALLNSASEEVRLRAARCLLNLGSDRGLEILREIAVDKGSAYRIEALNAIATAASRNDAASVSRKLLLDEDFDIRLAAYENLRKLDDIAIAQKPIARSFYLEQITQTKQAAIFVSRNGQPRIVLFGTPIYCRDNTFVQSADGNITINAPAGQKHVSLIRKHPTRPNISPIQLKSSFELSDIIQTLCREPAVGDNSQLRPGLGASYDDAIYILKQMCDKGAVEAEFRAGPLPGISLIIKR